jgi:DNA-binding response OmpR family regulator
MRILLVEDERHLSEAIVHILKQQHYTVDAVYDGMDGYHYILSDIYDIVILDVMLPSLNGYEVLRRIREEGMDTTILMLTARSQVSDRVKGLDYGADDYLTKPFAMDELVARLRALARRKDRQFEREVTTIGDIDFDKNAGELYNKDNSVHLTNLEMQLMELLLARRNMITSKEQIIVKLWGYDTDADDNNVEVYVSFLRKKLRFISKQVSIKTTRNVGYSLEVMGDV